MAGPVSISRHGTVAVITIDNPPVNALSREVRQGLLDTFTSLAADNTVSAVVINGGPGRFIAGADIKEMNVPPTAPSLPDVVAAINAFPKPVIAAIGGAALGGGFEIALACDMRIASPNATVGLPETRLGIIPGAGGTQRLPRLVGIARAITLICEARILKAAEAAEAGLIDHVVQGDVLAEALHLAPSTRKRRLSQALVPPGNDAEEEKVAASALSRSKGLPAIAEAIVIVRATRNRSFGEGLAQERAAFLRLRDSMEAKALRYLFFAERESAKVPGIEGVATRPIKRIAIIGAGTMGAGIAVALADAGFNFAVIERDAAAVSAGADRIQAAYDRQVKSGRLAAHEAQERIKRISLSEDWAMLVNADLVIEAAVEDLDIKRDIFRKLDEIAQPNAVLATNTSYLDVDAIAAVTLRPQNVLGLHFFAPANIMKLLEVVRGAKTSPDVLATALSFAKRIGKLPVVAGNEEGFIGNRIFSAYRRHAEYLVEDGAAPEQVDAALEVYGFAMGFFAVSDLSGLDIAWALRKRRAASRDPGERYVIVADTLCEMGRLGRKTGAGWYAYDSTGQKTLDPVVAGIIASARAAKGITRRSFTAEHIQRRLLAVMVNEGAKVLEEGIVLRPSDIDVVFVNGYGFPRHKGGPMWAADQMGLDQILAEMKEAHKIGGVGSEPASLLIELAKRDGTFSEWRKVETGS
jgi:3-hydroxyacyl-CoA dehydrogenase